MADRTQNINVNYNFRTVGVEQARAAVASVDTATKNLQQSATTSGQRLSGAFRDSTQSLASMQLQLARLKAQLELATNPAKVSQLSAQYKVLKAQVDATTKSLFDQGKAIKEVTTNTKGLTTNFTSLYNAIKTVIAAGIIREVANTAIEMAKLTGNVEGVDRAFRRAFPEAELLLADLKRATHGTVSEFELMQRTLQATNLGVSVNELGVLFEFAATRAQQTGESVDYLVDSIVRGIGRKSILVLDNLGLSATRLREQFNGASLASQSVADVTRGVAEIAKVELEKMGGFAETASTKVGQLTVSWQELRVELSKRFEEGGFVTQLRELIDSYQAALEAQRRGISIQELFEERQRQEIAQMGTRIYLQRILTGDREKDIKIIEDEIAALTKDIGAWTKFRDIQNELIKTQREEIQTLTLGTDGIKMTGRERQRQIKVLEDQIVLNKALRDANKEDALIDQESLRLLQAKLLSLKQDNITEKEALGIIETKKNQISALQDAIEKTRNLGDISSRLKVGELITQLAIAQAELKELLEGPINKEFNIKFNVESLKKAFEQEVEFIRTQTSEGADFFISVPIKPGQKDKSKAIKDFEKDVQDLLKDLPPVPIPVKPAVITPTTFGDQIGEEIEKNRDEIITSGFDIFSDQLKATEQIELASLQNRLNNLRNYYDEQTILAGDNEREKKEIRLREERETAALQKKIAEKDRQARRFSIIVDTATGIMRAFATLPTPAAIVQSAIIAALGISQLNIVNRTPARFKKGGYTGNAGVDEEVGIVHGQEYVTPAVQTRKSMGLLEAIKDNRIDDRILRNLQLSPNGVRVVPWNNKPVVDAINGNKPPDFVRIGRQMFEVFKDKEGNKKYIRSKSM